MRKSLNILLFVAAVLFFVIFDRSNVQSIQLHFLELQLIKPVPISLLILIPFLAGVVLGSLVNLLDRFSLKREVKRLKKDLRTKDGQIKPKDGTPPTAPGDAPHESGNAL